MDQIGSKGLEKIGRYKQLKGVYEQENKNKNKPRIISDRISKLGEIKECEMGKRN